MLFYNKLNAQIGRVYRSTTPQLDHLRDKLIIRMDQIMVYQLGSSSSSRKSCSPADMLVLSDSLDWVRVDAELAKLKSFCWYTDPKPSRFHHKYAALIA